MSSSNSDGVGKPIPSNDLHAVSVSLPTWDATLGWASRNESVLKRMENGYPRFFIHPLITHLSARVVNKFGTAEEIAILLSSREAAGRCLDFLRQNSKKSTIVRAIQLRPLPHLLGGRYEQLQWATIYPVFFSTELFNDAKSFWQHTGEGISSRRAEYCHALFDSLGQWEGPEQLVPQPSVQKKCDSGAQEVSTNAVPPIGKSYFYIEEGSEKHRIRSAIAAMISKNSRSVPVSDVFLYPSGMSAIWNLSRAIQAWRSSGDPEKIVTYGFLYVDTIKVLSRIETQEVILYGHGNEAELDKLEHELANGMQVQALYCEFPGNPLLKSPDLQRIRRIADKYSFLVVCDDTVGTFVNLNIMPYVDVICTSLTKLFSGGCNVMGGSLVLNPDCPRHDDLHKAISSVFVDTYFPPDAVMMERNGRDYPSRVFCANINAETIAELLTTHESVEHVYYPKNCSTRTLYDRCKRADAGYGYLMTVLFKKPTSAKTFFDRLDVAKGPSLGTNFTLACPYTLFAHYRELDWASSYGVVEHLVRISIGLEEPAFLITKFNNALKATEALV